jgi:hypothetical protein
MKDNSITIGIEELNSLRAGWVSRHEGNAIDSSKSLRDGRLLDSLVEGMHSHAGDVPSVFWKRVCTSQTVVDHVETQLLWHFDSDTAKSLRIGADQK